MRQQRLLALLILPGLIFVTGIRAETKKLEKPIYVHLSLRDNKAARVIGDLVSYDQTTICVRVGKEEKQVEWDNLTAASAYNLRWRLIDKNSGKDWLELGAYGWKLGMKLDAREALAKAVRLDKNLKTQADAILMTPAGETITKKPTPAAEAAETKFEKVSAEDAAKIIEMNRQAAKKIADGLHLKFTELQTDHYLLYTDWDPREYGFLKKNLEEAYAVVTKQFNIPYKQNIFLGKLPVFMIRSVNDFRQFAIRVDRFSPSKGVAGYFGGREDGLGHLVMFKPQIDGGDIRAAELEWAYVLAHENTHAFVSRYHGNRFVATWLNEGIAEVTATRSVPKMQTGYREKARAMAQARAPLSMIFNGDGPKAGEWYPVMHTVTELLIRMDQKAFLAMFNDIKEGMKPEEALRKNYRMDFKQLQAKWYQYMQ